MKKGPLSGIRVVEMSTFVAAPVTARLLGDMGADVIKIEAPTGDGWRNNGTSAAPRFNADENPVFDIYNTGKKLISLNLKTEKGKEAFFKLLENTDVFVTNLRLSALERLGLSYEDLKKRYPRLIYAVVLGYGEKGPDADKPAYDTTAFWSRGGFFRDMSIQKDTYEPVGTPSSVGDTATAYLLVAEICAALFRRSTEGTGEFVSSTLYRNGIFCMGTMIIKTQEPFGVKYPMKRLDYGVFGGHYECADGEWILLALGKKPGTVPKLMEYLGYPDLLTDPRFDTPEKRESNKAEFFEYFKKGFLSKPSDFWLDFAREYDMPLVRQVHFSDVSKDPQAWENGFLENVEFRSGNIDVMPTSPIEMESACPPPTKPAPYVGGDTVEVLLSIGYTEEEVTAMINDGSAVIPKQ